MSNKQLVCEIAGWYGAIAIFGAYVLVSFNVIIGTGLAFQLLNLTGAIGLMMIALYKNVKQSVALNVFWCLVAIITIAGIII